MHKYILAEVGIYFVSHTINLITFKTFCCGRSRENSLQFYDINIGFEDLCHDMNSGGIKSDLSKFIFYIRYNAIWF